MSDLERQMSGSGGPTSEDLERAREEREERAADYRELLLGCGHKRDKRMWRHGETPEFERKFRNLVTVDQNADCDPDFVVDLDVGPQWSPREIHREPWQEFLDDDGCFRANFFDEIHAYEVLEHLGAQGDAGAFFSHFSEMWRILKPNGMIFATVPSRMSPWLWGDPSHRRAILPESLVFLDQSAYAAQLDGEESTRTSMSDFRYLYRADFQKVYSHDNAKTHLFILRAVKPSRISL